MTPAQRLWAIPTAMGAGGALGAIVATLFVVFTQFPSDDGGGDFILMGTAIGAVIGFLVGLGPVVTGRWPLDPPRNDCCLTDEEAELARKGLWELSATDGDYQTPEADALIEKLRKCRDRDDGSASQR